MLNYLGRVLVILLLSSVVLLVSTAAGCGNISPFIAIVFTILFSSIVWLN